MIHKIVFRKMTLEENIDLIKWSYFEEDGTLSIHDHTIQCFPQLADLKDLTRDEINKRIEEVVTSDYREKITDLEKEVRRYSSLWEQYNDKYFKTLSSYLNIEWPNNRNIIEASVGLIPVFPRYLDDFSFSIGTGLDDLKIVEVCAHETLHFLWFEKWKELYPKTNREEYDSPYLPWKYSEMVTDPILNNKPFSDIFKFHEQSYDSFYELEDENNIKVMDKL